MTPRVLSESAERVRRAFQRNRKAVSLRPGIGRGTAVTTVRVEDGLRCEIEDGPWSLVADMSEKYGGGAAGPDPGVLGRSALGACLAIGYELWAAHRGVPIERLTVEVEADYDAGPELGVAEEGSPAYREVRVIVTVESEASEREVCEVLREADAHSSWLANLREPVEVSREVWFAAPRS